MKLNKSFYLLKQLGCMWYNRLSEYLFKRGYRNDLICLCIYMKILENEFSIIIAYVDDINIVGNANEVTKATNCFKNEFEMKDLQRTKFCLKIEIEYLNKDDFLCLYNQCA